MPSKFPSYILVSFFAFLLPIACLAEEEPQTLLTVEPSVASAVELLAEGDVQRPVRIVEYQTSVSPSRATAAASATYERLGKNVWGISTVQKTGNSVIQSRSLSLCGLIELLGATSATLQIDSRVPIPVSGHFVQMGMHVTKVMTSRSRTVHLSVPDGSANLCSLSPGGSFSYSVQTEVDLPQSPVGSPKVISNSFVWQCVAATAIDAGATIPAWQGMYIPVTCTSTNANGKPVTITYAYIIGGGLYLKMATMSELFKANTTYSAVATLEK
jgi:hypothetical protein